ncbi:type II toxin-antitoxin system HicA family toxin [Saxibacter everestensis]|uniref:Type II toxin-antitoxin system HicA family toxin n=1 Tax=Saxibacter everestensis TaxID=2909229 RepID=A0ABY8QWH3_9MICO|nr:type II toxin-antitoxin system HicA family toxin [Brevibacteriaceae bacterium ZFBP1038]
MRAREVEQRIRKLGGEHTRTVGSHKRFRITANDVTASTAVPQHSGDIPTGTLHKIEKDLEPALGKGWLRK